MRIKMARFNTPVDIRGNNTSGCTAENGVEMFRAANGDLIISWPASGGREADQIIVGHSNVNHCKPEKPITFDGAAKPEAKK